MIPKECKRLAEVDFPIAVVSRHAAAEKSGPKGHLSTLHLWWARRPLAACRAMLLGLLLPDPCDENCPRDFKKKARDLLPRVTGEIGSKEKDLRQALLKFIGDFANWDNSANQTFLDVSRGLVKAAHPEETPLVVDPFAGGGSIPLEALRLGCEAFASDLNPVACLIQKVMLEDIPRHGPELADELRRAGAEIRKAAEKELAEFYPRDPDGATPIAYLWARTVRCESPNCGAEIPLVRSSWLCKKSNRRCALRHEVLRPKGKPPRVEFEVFEPKNEKEVSGGTVARAKATCPSCGNVLSPERVRAQLADKRGGADAVFDAKGNRVGGARMLVVVTLHPGVQGRNYRLPTDRDYQAVWKTQKLLKAILDEWERGGKRGLCPVPDELLPPVGTLGFRVQRYGMLRWGDLFTARQKLALTSWIPLLIQTSGSSSPTTAGLALALSRMAMCGMSLTNWNAFAEKMQHTFGRQALPMVWDFAEVVPLVHAPGAWKNACDLVSDVAQVWPGSPAGQVQPADAAEHPLPDQTAAVWFTDPPYYDAVPYADLSDFFFVWLKRALLGHGLLRGSSDAGNPLTPKRREAVQDETKRDNGRPKDRLWFEETMARAFAEGRRILHKDGIGSVVFAHKTTEGWEALLSGMIRGGWTITGSWPIATEMASRLRARDSAALSASVHLVCRPRPEDAPVGDWGEVLRELPKRVGDWMERLQSEGIRGADLVFACIGPALEIFSRYSKVEDAAGRTIPLGGDPEAKEPDKRGYLAYVWETVGRIALQNILGTAEARARNGAAGALEEDARLTALFLWTLQSTNGEGKSEKENGKSEEEDEEEGADEEDEDESGGGKGKATKGFSLVYDVARRFAQPLGIHLPTWEGRIIETSKGIVRLMAVSERAKQLFGEDGARAVEERVQVERDMADIANDLFPEELAQAVYEVKGRRPRKALARGGATRGAAAGTPSQGTIAGAHAGDLAGKEKTVTTLDRVHAAMLLQAGGQANALRALIKAEQDRSPDFLRLANALSALYPKSSEEKRLVDAMLLAVPR